MRCPVSNVFLLIILLVFVSGCQGKPADYYTLRPIDIDYKILASCSVKYPKPLDMSAPTPGKVLKLLVDEGSGIRKGQALIQMDDFNERKNLEISSNTLMSTRLRIKNAQEEELPKLNERKIQLKADLDKAQNELDRNKRLLASGIISKVEVENSENNYQRALSAYNQNKLTLDSYEKSGAIADLKEQLAIQESQWQLARKALQDKMFTAPFNGTVTKVNKQAGESVQAGEIVLTVIEKSQWVLESEVDQKDLPFLGTNLLATIVFDAYPNIKVSADITYVCTLVDAQKGTCNLKFAIKENKDFIKYGMSGTAEIAAGTYKQKMTLPSRFVEKSEGQSYAWKWNGNSAERIKLDSEQIGEQWVVAKNLPAGTKVLLPISGINTKTRPGKEVTAK